MRRTNLFALLAFAALTVAAGFSQADALTGLKTYKEVVVNIVVTPSPAPIAWAPTAHAAPADAFSAPAQIASTGSTWDVPPGLGTLLAQQTAQPTPVPVQFNAIADPNAMYLHVVPHTPAAGYFAAPYGTTTFPCAFEIFTYYTNSYRLQDWGYNTSKTSGATSGTFPIENYPATSYLSWAVPDLSPTVTAYWNQGPGGETTWTGNVNQSQQHCIDLTLTVPSTQASGSFTATVQYSLYVTLP